MKKKKGIVLMITIAFLTVLIAVVILALNSYNSRFSSNNIERYYVMQNIAKGALNRAIAQLYANPGWNGETFTYRTPLRNYNVTTTVTPQGFPSDTVIINIAVSNGRNNIDLVGIAQVDILFDPGSFAIATGSNITTQGGNQLVFTSDDPNVRLKILTTQDITWVRDYQNNNIQAQNYSIDQAIETQEISTIIAKSITGGGTVDAAIAQQIDPNFKQRLQNNRDLVMDNINITPEFIEQKFRTFVGSFPNFGTITNTGSLSFTNSESIAQPGVKYINPSIPNQGVIYITSPGEYYFDGSLDLQGQGNLNMGRIQVRLPKAGEGQLYDNYRNFFNYVRTTFGNNSKYTFDGTIYTNNPPGGQYTAKIRPLSEAPQDALPIFIQANYSDTTTSSGSGGGRGRGGGGSGNATTTIIDPDFYFRTNGKTGQNFAFYGNKKAGINIYINGNVQVGGNAIINQIDTDRSNLTYNTLLRKPSTLRLYLASGYNFTAGNATINAAIITDNFRINGNPTIYGAMYGMNFSNNNNSSYSFAGSITFTYDSSLLSRSQNRQRFNPRLLHVYIQQ